MKHFLSFRLDSRNHCLWRDEKRVPITPKAFDVLRYLVENPGRLVTQEEILDALWPEIYVNQEVVKKYILGIRKVLGDRHDQPTFIETFPRRGYQFIAEVVEDAGSERSNLRRDITSKIVGRDGALAVLDHALDEAANGERQVVFLTGEAGIGKTALVDEFQRRLSRTDLRIARGQSVEGFGGKEAFYPVLEALGNLMRGQDGARVLELITGHAPTWLVQFPEFIKSEQRNALQQEIVGATSERMLREICDALEAMAKQDLLVLILEDLHWADASTLDLISALARRRDEVKLILLCTFRTANAGDPSGLKRLEQELLIHQLCRKIALDTLNEADVAAYIRQEFDNSDIQPGLASLVHRNSAGNALFVTALVQELVDREMIVRKELEWVLSKPLDEIAEIIPETFRQMIEVQFGQLDVLRRDVLKSACVAGERFSVWAIAATMEADIAEIEDACEKLADDGQFIRPLGIHELKSGEFSAHYEFRHALYRDLIYTALSEVARSRLHSSLAKRLESLYSAEDQDLASEIAMHFERGFDHENAIKYMIISAGNAAKKFAYRDSIQILQHALGLVHSVQRDKRPSIELRLIELIGDTYYLIGSMSEAAVMYEKQVDHAIDANDKVAQVHALGCLAMPLGFLDPDRGLVAAKQAVQLSANLADPLLLSQSRLMSSGYSLVYDAWRESDWEVWNSNFENATVLSDEPLPIYHRSLHSYLQLLTGDHRRVLSDLEDNSRKIHKPYSPIDNFFSISAKTIGLQLAGQFGELLTLLRDGRARAKKNGSDPWLFNFREAWLRIVLFDYEGAQRICADITEGSVGYPTGQPEALARLASGYLAIEAGNYEQAVGTFEEIIDTDMTPKFFLHWFWRMHAQLATGNAWLASGNLQKAGDAAEIFLRSALSTAEPNLKLLAWDLVARIAIAEGDRLRAEKAIQDGLPIVEQNDRPVKAWTLYATASNFYFGSGDFVMADTHRIQARSQVITQANTFSLGDPLRDTFSSAALGFIDKRK